jgi:hypothetical protein
MLKNEKNEYVAPKDLVHHPRFPVIYALSRGKVVDGLYDTSESGGGLAAVGDSPDTRVVLLLIFEDVRLVYSRESQDIHDARRSSDRRTDESRPSSDQLEKVVFGCPWARATQLLGAARTGCNRRPGRF